MSAEFEQGNKLNSFSQLLELMSMLRDKDHGCPWDLEQDFKSLTSFTLEEVYEVIDAVENNDPTHIKDELGDLLFQIVFYAQIAREKDLFDFDLVAASVTEKLLRRHPHVFPDGTLESFGNGHKLNSSDVVRNWEIIKNQERTEATSGNSIAGQSDQRTYSVLDDIPLSFPALERAKKIQKRAASIGFDWDELKPVVEKLKEEIAELEAVLPDGSHERKMDELGDVLFSCVNLARHIGVEPERALRYANNKFENRFRKVEQLVTDSGKKIPDLSLTELDVYWGQVKKDSID